MVLAARHVLHPTAPLSAPHQCLLSAVPPLLPPRGPPAPFCALHQVRAVCACLQRLLDSFRSHPTAPLPVHLTAPFLTPWPSARPSATPSAPLQRLRRCPLQRLLQRAYGTPRQLCTLPLPYTLTFLPNTSLVGCAVLRALLPSATSSGPAEGHQFSAALIRMLSTPIPLCFLVIVACFSELCSN